MACIGADLALGQQLLQPFAGEGDEAGCAVDS
jgi:hypothetical protein